MPLVELAWLSSREPASRGLLLAWPDVVCLIDAISECLQLIESREKLTNDFLPIVQGDLLVSNLIRVQLAKN